MWLHGHNERHKSDNLKNPHFDTTAKVSVINRVMFILMIYSGLHSIDDTERQAPEIGDLSSPVCGSVTGCDGRDVV